MEKTKGTPEYISLKSNLEAEGIDLDSFLEGKIENSTVVDNSVEKGSKNIVGFMFLLGIGIIVVGIIGLLIVQ
ncbi:MAG: hypothetical protein Kapaf2KO_05530 [Candidatus Kapaibacteriales bacterium]